MLLALSNSYNNKPYPNSQFCTDSDTVLVHGRAVASLKQLKQPQLPHFFMLSFLRKLLSLGIAAGLAWLSIAFCLGGIVPYDFVESKTPPSALTDSWRVLGADQLVTVSERALLGNSLTKAEQAASKALWRDPTHGGAATQLALIYFRQGKIMEADRMAERAQILWPSRCSTNLMLVKYWRERGQAEKGLKTLPAGCKT